MIRSPAAQNGAKLLESEDCSRYQTEDDYEMEKGHDDDLSRMMFNPFIPRQESGDCDDQQNLSCGPDRTWETEAPAASGAVPNDVVHQP